MRIHKPVDQLVNLNVHFLNFAKDEESNTTYGFLELTTLMLDTKVMGLFSKSLPIMFSLSKENFNEMHDVLVENKLESIFDVEGRFTDGSSQGGSMVNGIYLHLEVFEVTKIRRVRDVVNEEQECQS